MKDKILGNVMTEEFEGFKVSMLPVPRLQLVKLMAKYDLSEPSDVGALGADLAPLCITDIEGPIKVSYTNLKIGADRRRVVKEEVFEQLGFEPLAKMLGWVVTQHFLGEDEKGN